MTDDLVGAPDADGTDPVVQTALRLLPVPDHGPGFWTVLGAALALESASQVDEPALAVGPARRTPLVAAPVSDSQGSAVAADQTARRPVAAAATAASPDLAVLLVPPAMRRRSNIVLLAVGLAAATLVAVSGVALVRNRAEGGLGPVDAIEQPLALVAAPTASLEGSRIGATTVGLEAA